MAVSSYAWYWALGVAQGGLVLIPRPPRSPVLVALRHRWALIALPLACATAATFLPAVAARLAGDLSTLALLAVPVLAVLAGIWIVGPNHRAFTALGIVLLLAVAWADPGLAAADGAVLTLVALSAAAAAMIAVAVVPTMVVKIGIGVWALVDLGVALSHRLAEASNPIIVATPTVGTHLQLQRVVLGSASMEWADFFVAATLGAVLVAERRRRGPAALLLALLAVAFSVFFLVTDVLPATVPVAIVLLAETARTGILRPKRLRRRSTTAPAPQRAVARTLVSRLTARPHAREGDSR